MPHSDLERLVDRSSRKSRRALKCERIKRTFFSWLGPSFGWQDPFGRALGHFFDRERDRVLFAVTWRGTYHFSSSGTSFCAKCTMVAPWRCVDTQLFWVYPALAREGDGWALCRARRTAGTCQRNAITQSQQYACGVFTSFVAQRIKRKYPMRYCCTSAFRAMRRLLSGRIFGISYAALLWMI